MEEVATSTPTPRVGGLGPRQPKMTTMGPGRHLKPQPGVLGGRPPGESRKWLWNSACLDPHRSMSGATCLLAGFPTPIATPCLFFN
jgi:hypothetical protein